MKHVEISWTVKANLWTHVENKKTRNKTHTQSNAHNKHKQTKTQKLKQHKIQPQKNKHAQRQHKQMNTHTKQQKKNTKHTTTKIR